MSSDHSDEHGVRRAYRTGHCPGDRRRQIRREDASRNVPATKAGDSIMHPDAEILAKDI